MTGSSMAHLRGLVLPPRHLPCGDRRGWPAPQQPAVAKQTPAAAPAQQTATQSSAEPTKQKTKGRKKAAAPSQAEIDADRERIMGPTSDSVIRKGNMVAEGFSFFRPR